MKHIVERGHDLETIERFLKCPQDRGPLRWTGEAMRCEMCGTNFPASPDGILDLRPRQPSFWGGGEYGRRYRETLAAPSEHAGAAWGAAESLSQVDLARKRRHVEAVGSLLFAEPV